MRRYIAMAALAAVFVPSLYGCQPAGPGGPTRSNVNPPEADAKPPSPEVKPATAEPVVDKDQAIAMIQKVGGSVTLDEKAPGKPVVGVNLSQSYVKDAGLKELAALKGLQSLNLSGTAVTDAGLKELAALKGLQTLNLSECLGVTDAGLKELAALKGLQTLNLSECPGVTDAGLKELAALKGLQTLNLYNTQVTDARLKELAALKDLRALALPVVTDGALRTLREMGLLQALSQASAAGATRPASLEDVRILNLEGTAVTDAGLKESRR